ncbi:flippase [Kaistia soli]|uniref:flippase n=1 Tax=Kaistia soli TaxID=446684 RepID=UPI001587FCE1|nr:flippase [Kaistia soli]
MKLPQLAHVAAVGRLAQQQFGKRSSRLVAGNFMLLLLEKFVRFGLSFVVGAWVLRYLGPTRSGSITYVAATVAIMLPLARLGLDPLLLRDSNQKPEQRGTMFGSAIALRAIAGIVLFAISLGISAVDGNLESNALLVAILSLVLISQPYEVFELWFQASGQVRKPVTARLTALFILAGLRVASILSGAGILVFAFLQTLESWITSAINYAFYRSSRPFPLTPRAKTGLAMLQEGWPYMLSGLMIIVYMRIDQIMLGNMIDKRAVGIFYAATSLLEAAYFIPTMLNVALVPTFMQAAAKDPFRYRAMMSLHINFALFYSMIAAVALHFLAPYIILFLYHERFADSIPVLQVYAFAYVFVCVGLAQSNWFVVERKGRITLLKSCIGAAVNILLNLWLIPRYGVVGAAYSTIAAQFAATYGSAILFNRQLLHIQFVLPFSTEMRQRLRQSPGQGAADDAI